MSLAATRPGWPSPPDAGSSSMGAWRALGGQERRLLACVASAHGRPEPDLWPPPLPRRRRRLPTGNKDGGQPRPAAALHRPSMAGLTTGAHSSSCRAPSQVGSIFLLRRRDHDSARPARAAPAGSSRPAENRVTCSGEQLRMLQRPDWRLAGERARKLARARPAAVDGAGDNGASIRHLASVAASGRPQSRRARRPTMGARKPFSGPARMLAGQAPIDH
jgi:hypothetical protein